MIVNAFIAILVSSALVFLVPARLKWHFVFVLQLFVFALSGWLAVTVLLLGQPVVDIPFFWLVGNNVHLVIDSLSAYFILVINFTSVTGGLYARGYLKPYLAGKNATEMSLHYFSFLWLHFSMIMVCMVRDGLAFLMVWEMMAISSFMLVIFESEKPGTVKIGINYLIQMHVALVFIMGGLIYATMKSGSAFSLDGLSAYFAGYSPFPLFLVFFIGFGIKAGFMPLHTWLPHAHPAAPAHVSGVMSGVMIKIGIYGILRVLTFVHTDLFRIGVFILVVALVSGLLGVMLAIVQHDVKKLLAYHSIENIGIIGIGIGLGLIGVSRNIVPLALLGLTGGLLHILNHSLFKSVLFYAAGSVNQQTHTRQIDRLGGLIKAMPKTAIFFLLGALAICGLPPFNGFISEFLIYSALFKSLQLAGISVDLVLLATTVGLVLIGGLAIFCFTKVFSIIFLGSPRTLDAHRASEVSGSMILSKVATAVVIVAIGLAPGLFVKPLIAVSGLFTNELSTIDATISVLDKVGIGSWLFIGFATVLWIIRGAQQKNVKIEFGPTWGCAYTGGNPSTHQYTATSFGQNYVELARQVVNVKTLYTPLASDEIFSGPRKFETHSSDLMEDYLVTGPITAASTGMEKAAIFQTGKLQHYVLYALVFMVVIFLLTIFQLI